GIARAHHVDHHVLLGMMAARRILLEIVDDGPQGVEVGALPPVEDAELPFEDAEQLLDVAMLFAQDVDEFRHGPIPVSWSPARIRMTLELIRHRRSGRSSGCKFMPRPARF